MAFRRLHSHIEFALSSDGSRDSAAQSSKWLEFRQPKMPTGKPLIPVIALIRRI